MGGGGEGEGGVDGAGGGSGGLGGELFTSCSSGTKNVLIATQTAVGEITTCRVRRYMCVCVCVCVHVCVGCVCVCVCVRVCVWVLRRGTNRHGK